MIKKIRTHRLYPVLLLALLLTLLVYTVAYAANIDGTDKWAWGTNVGWLNFAPTHGGGVTVYTDHLEGYVWGENIGWISLWGTAQDSTPYGVSYNNSTGELSGYAWSTNVGWINFQPSHGGGVWIDTSTGDFSGYAWGENIGWIKLAGTAQDTTTYKVRTTNPTSVTLTNLSARSGNHLAILGAITLSVVGLGGWRLWRKRH